jgi:hypothetical protein
MKVISMKWTEDELQLRRIFRRSSTCPDWRCVFNGFLFFVTPTTWSEEVIKQRDGTWIAGSEADRTFRIFSDCRAALNYGDSLAQPSEDAMRLHQYDLDRSYRLMRQWRSPYYLTRYDLAGISTPIVAPPGFTMTRVRFDSIEQEKNRRDDVVLE